MTVGELEHVFDVFMSPGSVTERLHFSAAPYTPEARTASGGGLAHEGEDIGVVELPFDEARRNGPPQGGQCSNMTVFASAIRPSHVPKPAGRRSRGA